MVDSPLLSDFDFKALAARYRLTTATPAELARLSAAQRGKSLILVQDAFTRYFETPVFAAFIELASRMGYRVWLAPFMANGKPLHVQGFLPAFERTARRTAKGLQALAGFDIPLVGLDPAMTLVYRQEYRKIAGLECPDVLLPQEWLLKALDGQPKLPAKSVAFRLLGHCTEKTNAAPSAAMWVKVFEQAGLQVAAEATGCCGMSGTYGHEARNLETSRTIFAQSWEPALDSGAAAEPLATGYSCRSQVARLKNATLRHPIQVLLEHLQ